MTTAHPLSWPAGWPRTPHHKQEDGRSRFRRQTYGEWTFAEARDDLLSELGRLGARSIVLSTNFALRRDGLPLASQGRPDDQGIAVYFTLRGKPLAMARDQFRRAEHNMRSLSLAIDGLRQLERHGGSFMMERAFAGFEALPPPKSPWDVLGVPPRAPREEITAAYRRKAQDAHPDRGGSTDAMAELNRARDDALRQVSA